MIVAFLVLSILLSWAALVAADVNVRVPPASPLILYSDGWTTTEGSDWKETKNASLYFLYRGSSLKIHYSPPLGGSLFVWIDGTRMIDLISSAFFAGTSTLDPTLKEFPINLADANHQVYVNVTPAWNNSAAIFAGFEVTSSDGNVTNIQYGLSNPTLQGMEIIGATALNYTGQWETDARSWASTNSTLRTTKSVGASVSLYLPNAAADVRVYGTLMTGTPRVNVSYALGDKQVYGYNYRLGNDAFNDIKQSLIQVPLLYGGSFDGGGQLTLTLTEGTLTVDFIAVRWSTVTRNHSSSTMVVLITLACLVLVAGPIYCYCRRRRKPTAKQQGQGVKTLPSSEHNLVPLENLSLSSVNRSELNMVHEEHQPSWQNPPPSPSEERHVNVTNQPLYPRLSSHTAPDISSNSIDDLPPAWSPPPPSYLTISAIVAEDREARGLMPLSQDALEHLFERVVALRRANGPSLDRGLSQIREHVEMDRDMEALAQQIAGVDIGPRPAKR